MNKIIDQIEKIEDAEQVYKYFDEKGQHLHTYLGKPLLGTSTVCGVLAKNLTWWSAELSAVECLEAGELIPTIREEYLACINSDDKKKAIDALQVKYPIFKKARFAHFVKKNDSAKEGTDLHAELERYVKNTIAGKMATYDDKIMPFINWCNDNVEKFLWSELHCYSDQLWVGGISDCGVQLKNGKTGIIDFKSAKESFDSHFIQIAGYDIQISENGGFNADGYKIFSLKKPLDFYAVVPFGGNNFSIDFRYDVDELQEGFRSCVTLYKITNK